MLRRHVLAAIAQGVAAGDVDVARRALARIDWVLRGRARRRLEAALIDAALATGVLDPADPAAARHLLGGAGLLIRGDARVGAGLDAGADAGADARIALADRAAVAAAFGDPGGIRAPRAPLASIAAGAAILTMATAVVAATLAVEPYPGRFERPPPPPPVGAYRDGGVPGRDPAIEATLGALRAGVAPERAPGGLAHVPEIASAWTAVVDEIARYDGDDDRELRARVQALSDRLAAGGLGYFVDLEVRPFVPPMLTAYRVEKVTFVRADDDRIRVLDLRRLAGQAATKPWLGMKPEGLSDPVVLVDQVESYVRNELLPVLGGARYELADDRWSRTAVARGAATAATRAIRRELVTATGTRRDVEHRIRRLLVASVRHHEAQHGLEHDREPVHPEALIPHVGPLRDGRGRIDPHALRARNELSAYASQIASDMWLPQVALWSLARHAFRLQHRLTPEAIAAVVVLEGLARELGISTRGTALGAGMIDRDRLAGLVAPLARVPTIELRSAAARLWATLYGAPLVRLVDDVFGE